MINTKEKIPSQFSAWSSPEYIINLKFINFSNTKKSCGRAENRTRNCWVTTNHLATKLLAHDRYSVLNYLNFVSNFVK